MTITGDGTRLPAAKRQCDHPASRAFPIVVLSVLAFSGTTGRAQEAMLVPTADQDEPRTDEEPSADADAKPESRAGGTPTPPFRPWQPPWVPRAQDSRGKNGSIGASAKVPTTPSDRPRGYGTQRVITADTPRGGALPWQIHPPTINEQRPGRSPTQDELWLILQTGPAGGIRDIDISPDGKYAVNAGDATPRMWNLETGEVIRELSGHRQATNSACFTADGKYVLTAGRDSYVRCWDWRARRLVASYGPHKRLAQNDPLVLVRTTADVRRVVTTDRDADSNLQLVLWDFDTGVELQRLKTEPSLRAAAINRDATVFATGDATGVVRLWDTGVGKVIATLPPRGEPIACLAFSPAEEAIAVFDRTGGAIFRALRGNPQRTPLAQQSAPTTAATYSAEGRWLVACDSEGAVGWHDTQTGALRHRSHLGRGTLSAACVSPDATRVVVGDASHSLLVAERDAGIPAKLLKGHTRTPTGAVIADDPARLIVATAQSVLVWDLASGSLLQGLGADPSSTLGRSGRRVLWCDEGGTLQVRELPLGGEVREGPRLNAQVYGALISEDDRRIVVISSQGAHLIDGATLSILKTCDIGPVDRWTRFVLSPSGDRLISHGHGAPKLWDLLNGKRIAQLTSPEHRPTTAGFRSDGAVFTIGDQALVCWRDDGKVQEITPLGFSSSGAAAPVVRGQTLAVAEGEDVHLVEIDTGEVHRTLVGHDETVTSLSFTPDGKRLITTSNDQTCRIWDRESGQQHAMLACLDNGDWVMVDHEGRFDGSRGGQVEGIHWVVGEEVITLEQLRERYYEPQLLAKVLGFHPEPRREVAQFRTPRLFPKVALNDVDPEAPRLTIQLENRGGGIGRVSVRINGKELEADARGDRVDAQAARAELSIDLSGDPRIEPGEDNVVEVVAYNQEGYLASRDLRRVFRPAKTTDAPPPRVWAVVAGASDYRGDAIDLRFAAKDAADFATAVRLGAARLFGSANLKLTLLTTDLAEPGKQPTRDNILAALRRARGSTASDLLVLYLAGHGVNLGGRTGDFYFLTSEASSPDLSDPEVRQATAISSGELASLIREIPARKQVMILDTCASGRLVEQLTEKRGVPSSQIRALERVKHRTGMHVLAGCAADAVSYEASRYGQGLLTHSLLLGMQGAALREQEYVDVVRLFNFVADRVPQLAQDVGGIQRPAIASPTAGGSFDVGRLVDEDRNRIPLQTPLPLVLRTNFQDDLHFADTLQLSRRLDEQLSALASRGAQAPLVFVDAAQMPGALRLVGRYTVTDDQVAVDVRLFRGADPFGRYAIRGTRSNLDGLAAEILAALRERL